MSTTELPPMPRRSAPLAAVALPVLVLVLAACGSLPAVAQGSRIGAPPAGPNKGPAMPSPTEQVLPDDIQATATALRDAALKGTRAHALVASLTTEVGPRPAGSPAYHLAEAWAVRTFKELGGFTNIHTETVTVPRWERGEESAEITAPYRQRLVVAAMGGSVGTPAGGVEAPVVQVASLEALDKLDAVKVRGKIVFINAATDRTRDGAGYGKAVVGRFSGAAHAGKLGAVALLIRSIGTDSNRLAHTGAMRYDDGGPQIPAAALSIPDADVLTAELASGKPVTVHLHLGARSLPAEPASNVIADIVGSEKPEEIVLLGCHLDSWDLGTGAIDDAAGCGIVMEAARRIGELKRHPRRTVRVVLFANEEFGLQGAEGYATAHAKELPQHVVCLESDLGSGRVWRLESRVAVSSLGWVRELGRLVFPIGVGSGTNEGESGADLTPLQRAGVPVISLMQDATAYFDFHHTANDTLDKANSRDLDYNVAAWASVVYAAADLQGDFGRVLSPTPNH